MIFFKLASSHTAFSAILQSTLILEEREGGQRKEGGGTRVGVKEGCNFGGAGGQPAVLRPAEHLGR